MSVKTQQNLILTKIINFKKFKTKNKISFFSFTENEATAEDFPFILFKYYTRENFLYKDLNSIFRLMSSDSNTKLNEN